MGNAGNYVGSDRAYFEAYLNKGDYHRAIRHAFALPWLTVKDALRLTMLAGQHDRDRFERMARRWLGRFVQEKEPTLGLLVYVIEDLNTILLNNPIDRGHAEARLQRMVEKL
jgi:hypothetical protein